MEEWAGKEDSREGDFLGGRCSRKRERKKEKQKKGEQRCGRRRREIFLLRLPVFFLDWHG